MTKERIDEIVKLLKNEDLDEDRKDDLFLEIGDFIDFENDDGQMYIGKLRSALYDYTEINDKSELPADYSSHTCNIIKMTELGMYAADAYYDDGCNFADCVENLARNQRLSQELRIRD